MIPKSVDVKGMLSGLNLSPTRRENIKNKIYYFLSLLVLTNDNYALNIKNKGFRCISSVRMRKIMGRKDYYSIIRLLSDPINPVIESDASYRSADLGGVAYPKGYRLCQKHNTGEIEWRTIPEKFSKRIKKHIKKDSTENFDDSKYRFLYDQFTVNKLSIDPAVKDYIYSFGQQLLTRANNNEYQTNMVLNHIGRWLNTVEKIENDELWYQVSPANWRLNSSVTHLKRTLRPFLLCNGEKLVEVDITASQPYILSAVMNTEFISGNNGYFNLQSIYPEAFIRLTETGFITTSSVENSYSFGYTSYSGSSMHSDFNLDSVSSTGSFKKSYSFMWGLFFNDVELNSIKSYQASPFDKDFYRYLINRSNIINCQETSNEDVLRKKLKDNMKLVLFDDNKHHRDNSIYIKMFYEAFPGVNKLICTLHSLIGKSGFSYLLQRAESYLVLDVVSRNFHHKFPTAPIFTVHDAICTYPEYLDDLKRLIVEHSQNLIGTPVGLKEKIWESNPVPKPEDIEDMWAKIRQVKTLEKYQKKAHSVFQSNIERGKKFLSL